MKKKKNHDYNFEKKLKKSLKMIINHFLILDSLKSKNIYRIYPHSFFCNNFVKERCIVHNKNEIFYDDYNHLSTKGSEIVSEIIYERIKEILKDK